MYKAKCKKTESWVFGSLFKSEQESYILQVLIPDEKTYSWDNGLRGYGCYGYEVDSSTLCCSIGKTDSNNNIIYTNDIVRAVYDGEERILVVVWDQDELDFKATNGKENYGKTFLYISCCDEIEVIGNSIDNPELLCMVGKVTRQAYV